MTGAIPARDEVLHHAPPALVLCEHESERRAFLRYGKLPAIVTGPGAASIRRAFEERHTWPVPRPRLVILHGLARALAPSIEAGTALAPSRVSGVAATPASIGGEAPTTILETDTPPRSAGDAARLRAATNADLADSASAAFAAAADEARIPWAIVRGVAATAGEEDTVVEAPGRDPASPSLLRPGLLLAHRRRASCSRLALRDAAFAADALGSLPPLALCTARTPLLLYGGSFDPPHARHATMLADAIKALGAPCAIVMPAAINPLKTDTPPADPTARLAMCRAAFGFSQGGVHDGLGEIRLSRREIEREGPSYTIDTILALVSDHPSLAGAVRFLVGSDAIRSIERWHRWRELVALAAPAVVVRPPDDASSVRGFLESLESRTGATGARGWLLDLPPRELSSTGLRESIDRGERPEGIADGVWREIEARGLYGVGAAR